MDAPEQAQAINLVHQNKLHHETTYDDKLSDFAKGYVNRTSPAPIRPIQPLTTKQYKSLTFLSHYSMDEEDRSRHEGGRRFAGGDRQIQERRQGLRRKDAEGEVLEGLGHVLWQL